MMYHIAHCCLEGSTMSNLVHRRRRCARIIVSRKLLPGGQYARVREVYYVFVLCLTGHLLHIALCCLEGSTMCNLVHRRRRCARIVTYMILCLEGSTSEDGRFILVYRLGEDVGLLQGRWWYGAGLGIKSTLL